MSNRTWLIALLIISMGINLLIVGIFVGRQGFAHRPDRGHFDWMAKDLNTAKREVVRNTMRAHMRESAPLRKELRFAQRELREAVSAEMYDEKVVASAFAKVRAASEKFQATMHGGMMKTFSGLDRKDRLKVYRMLSMRERGHGRNKGAHRPTNNETAADFSNPD